MGKATVAVHTYAVCFSPETTCGVYQADGIGIVENNTPLCMSRMILRQEAVGWCLIAHSS